jgi:hypothetical protein
LTSSVLDAPHAASRRGERSPRICAVPPSLSSAGAEAVDLAASAGLHLDPWQAYVLDQSLGERDDGKWAAFEVGLIVSRQNGKGAILEARELAGLFLFGEELLLHSAHEFKTAADAFRRISSLITDTKHLSRQVKRIRTANGSEMVELKTGQRLQFVARTAGSGRGFSADLVVLDEAYELGDEAMEALLPTLSARPNPQIWYTSTAGKETSVQLGRVRERGIAGREPSLAFFEWSAEDGDDPHDPATWAKANPGMPARISEDYVRREHAALSAEGFAKERLGIGRYPVDLLDAWAVIPAAAWTALADPGSQPDGPLAFAVAVDGREGRRGAIGVAGRRADGLLHAELADYRPGTSWIVPRLAEMYREHGGTVVVDAAGYEGSLIQPLEAAGVPVTKPASRDVAAAFGQFCDAVTDSKSLRHLGQAPLDAAVAAAAVRDVGDAGRTWGRRVAAGDISPLVAVTLAAWAAAAGTQQFFGSWR